MPHAADHNPADHNAAAVSTACDGATPVQEPGSPRTLDDVAQGSGWWAWARGQLALPRARKWYPGSIFGLVYLAIPLWYIGSVGADPWSAVVTVLLIVLVAAGFVLIPPLLWETSVRTAGLTFAGYFLLTCLLFPFLGLYTLWMWVYVSCIAGMTAQRRWLFGVVAAGVAVLQLTVMFATGSFADNWYTVLLTASIGIMMWAFSRQILTVVKLRAAQSEVARLAVVDERARFARDMHDVLGHSLTVVTVKSELARRLVAMDPARAEEEIADIERLSRAALADLRTAVAGYRDMSLSTEIAAAHAALASAEIRAHLPASVDGVAAELRELFAWVLRESVTNVIRHSGAHNCWVAVERRAIMIGDDGRGGVLMTEDGSGASRGHGLAGLSERAAQAGATLTVTASEDGGTLVTARGRRP